MATVSEPEKPAETSPSWPANPAPLGLMGFGFTTLMLSFINANIVGTGATPIVFGLALAFGGLGQVFAGLWSFRTGNTFAATAFTSYGGFWISYFILTQLDIGAIPSASVAPALGLYLWMWGIFTFLLFLCTFTSPRALSLLFLLLTLTFIFLGIGNAGGHSGIVHLGGYVGIVTGAVAFYIATADIMEFAYGRSVLPIGAPS